MYVQCIYVDIVFPSFYKRNPYNISAAWLGSDDSKPRKDWKEMEKKQGYSYPQEGDGKETREGLEGDGKETRVFLSPG